MRKKLSEKDRLRAPYSAGGEDELTQIITWLKGPHVGSGTAAWEEAVRPLLDEIAMQLNAGAHWNA